MRRHDLAYVSAEARPRFHCGAVDEALSSRVSAWIGAGRPLVVARQPAGCGDVLLGLTLPPGEGRQRIGCLVRREDVAQLRGPLGIGECVPRLTDEVALPLAALDRRLAAAGVRGGVYGSVAWEVLSGQAYRHAASDVDLICDVASVAQAAACLRMLADAAAELPCGLDGEVRFPDGAAVAWRELAAAWGRPDARVLVKGEVDVGLLPLSVMLKRFEEDGLHV